MKFSISCTVSVVFYCVSSVAKEGSAHSRNARDTEWLTLYIINSNITRAYDEGLSGEYARLRVRH